MGRTRWMVAALAAAVATAVAVAAPAAAAEKKRYRFDHGDASKGVAVIPPTPTPSARRRGRIVGGRIVKASDEVKGARFAVKIFNEVGSTFFCMGSLVSRSYVMTSASCGVKAGMKVRVGGLDLYKGWYLNIEAATPYPWYQAGSQINDLAMLKLENPPTLADYADSGVVPIEMAPNGFVPPMLRVSGWGANNSDGSGPAWGGGTRELRSGFMPTNDFDICNALLSEFRNLSPATQICANFESLEDTALCYLDTGGALWDRRWIAPNTYQYRLYGIASYWAIAEGSGEVCPFGEPNMFTKVRPYLWWTSQFSG